MASRERATREKRELDEKVTLLVNENEALSKELKLVQEQRNKATVDNTDNSERVLVLEVHPLTLRNLVPGFQIKFVSFKILNIFKLSFKSQINTSRREIADLTDKLMNSEVLKNQLENQLTIVLEEQQTLTSEKTTADQDRNLMANRNVELENEIVEHLQGIFSVFSVFKFKSFLMTRQVRLRSLFSYSFKSPELKNLSLGNYLQNFAKWNRC